MRHVLGEMRGTNYVTRDNFGMYADSSSGPGSALMGTNTLLGNDVYNKDGEDLASGVHRFHGTSYGE